MILLDGKTLSTQILSSLKLEIRNWKLEIKLSVILLGNDPSSLKYVSLKQKKCKEIGIKFDFHHLPENTSQSALLALIAKLNQNPSVTGFFIQLPLPGHIDKKLVLSQINPKKDIDGLNPNSDFRPAVVDAIITLLEHYQIEFTNKKIAIFNDSDLIGRPLKKIFEDCNAQVTVINRTTKNITAVTQVADIIISATSIKNIITANLVKDGAIVVDVANGDVDFADVSQKCSYITPTFGGVGPMTIACLLKNLVKIVQ